jgi:hypothetical protein
MVLSLPLQLVFPARSLTKAVPLAATVSPLGLSNGHLGEFHLTSPSANNILGLGLIFRLP